MRERVSARDERKSLSPCLAGCLSTRSGSEHKAPETREPRACYGPTARLVVFVGVRGTNRSSSARSTGVIGPAREHKWRGVTRTRVAGRGAR